MQNSKFYIDSLTCTSCAASIEKHLSSNEGIQNFSIDVLTKVVELEYDKEVFNEKTILKFLNKSGYLAEEIDD